MGRGENWGDVEDLNIHRPFNHSGTPRDTEKHVVDTHEVHGLPRFEKNDSGEDITRRDFVKFLVGGAAIAGSALVGKEIIENIADNAEAKERDIIDEMKKSTQETKVKEHGTLWDLYEESGYAEKGYPETSFYKAVEDLNPGKGDQLRRRLVYMNETLIVPILNNPSE
jgi:hypothetical protein